MRSEQGKSGGRGARPPKETDRLEVRTSETKRTPTEAESRLMAAIESVHFTDERGEAAYQNAIGALRERPDELRKIVTDFELATPNDHNLHWTLHFLLADLEMPELASVFVDTAVRDLPDIDSTTPCEGVEEDRILVATMAVEGLARLTRKEPEAAIAALMEVVERQPNVAVRTAAVQAILSVRPNAEADVARLLPEDQLHVLEARRIPAEQLSALPERATPKRSGQRSPKLPSDTNLPHPREAQAKEGTGH